MEINLLIVGILGTNSYLLSSENELGLIDPGAEPEKILDKIRETRCKLKYIINTHYHHDHTGADEKIKKETGAEILIHEKEKDFINFKADRFLKDGEEIKIGKIVLKVLHTPGHTPGGICLLGEDFIFTGDTLFKDGYGRTDLKGGSQEDLVGSLKKIGNLLVPGMMVYPGHGEFFLVEEF
jgi:hydroxyacylglutathione hydrolase